MWFWFQKVLKKICFSCRYTFSNYVSLSLAHPVNPAASKQDLLERIISCSFQNFQSFHHLTIIAKSILSVYLCAQCKKWADIQTHDFPTNLVFLISKCYFYSMLQKVRCTFGWHNVPLWENAFQIWGLLHIGEPISHLPRIQCWPSKARSRLDFSRCHLLLGWWIYGHRAKIRIQFYLERK